MAPHSALSNPYCIGIIWDLYERAARLYVRSFDPSSRDLSFGRFGLCNRGEEGEKLVALRHQEELFRQMDFHQAPRGGLGSSSQDLGAKRPHKHKDPTIFWNSTLPWAFGPGRGILMFVWPLGPEYVKVVGGIAQNDPRAL